MVRGSLLAEQPEIEAITSFPVTGVWTNYLDGTKLHVTSIPTGLMIPAHECRVYINF